jgi:hypothetical protein
MSPGSAVNSVTREWHSIDRKAAPSTTMPGCIARSSIPALPMRQRRSLSLFAAHCVSEIDVCLTDKLLASAEHSKLRFEPRSSAKNVMACFALRSILTC